MAGKSRPIALLRLVELDVSNAAMDETACAVGAPTRAVAARFEGGSAMLTSEAIRLVYLQDAVVGTDGCRTNLRSVIKSARPSVQSALRQHMKADGTPIRAEG